MKTTAETESVCELDVYVEALAQHCKLGAMKSAMKWIWVILRYSVKMGVKLTDVCDELKYLNDHLDWQYVKRNSPADPVPQEVSGAFNKQVAFVWDLEIGWMIASLHRQDSQRRTVQTCGVENTVRLSFEGAVHHFVRSPGAKQETLYGMLQKFSVPAE